MKSLPITDPNSLYEDIESLRQQLARSEQNVTEQKERCSIMKQNMIELEQQLADSQKREAIIQEILKEFLPYITVSGYEREQRFLQALAATEPKL